VLIDEGWWFVSVSRRADVVAFGLLGLVTFLGLLWTRWHTAAGAAECLIGLALLAFAVWKRRWIPLLAFGAAQVVAFFLLFLWIALIFTVPIVEDYASRVSFDEVLWKADNTEAPRGRRIHMVDDLLRRHRLVGMSQAQVEDLLGAPPPTEYFREYDYVYWLGPERGAFSIDSEWLVLKLDKGRVIHAEVVTD
jgi:hypothetical protein